MPLETSLFVCPAVSLITQSGGGRRGSSQTIWCRGNTKLQLQIWDFNKSAHYDTSTSNRSRWPPRPDPVRADMDMVDRRRAEGEFEYLRIKILYILAWFIIGSTQRNRGGGTGDGGVWWVGFAAGHLKDQWQLFTERKTLLTPMDFFNKTLQRLHRENPLLLKEKIKKKKQSESKHGAELGCTAATKNTKFKRQSQLMFVTYIFIVQFCIKHDVCSDQAGTKPFLLLCYNYSRNLF